MTRLFYFLGACSLLCAFGFSFPQIGGNPIGDGSNIFNGPNPPGGVGVCWDFVNQVAISKLGEDNFNGRSCDPVQECEPIFTCGPVAAAARPAANCLFIKTHESVHVGDCNNGFPNKTCSACPGGSERLCMVYSFHISKSATGACQTRCGWYQVHYDGNCVQ